jgi:hypothetical protein
MKTKQIKLISGTLDWVTTDGACFICKEMAQKLGFPNKKQITLTVSNVAFKGSKRIMFKRTDIGGHWTQVTFNSKTINPVGKASEYLFYTLVDFLNEFNMPGKEKETLFFIIQ